MQRYVAALSLSAFSLCALAACNKPIDVRVINTPVPVILPPAPVPTPSMLSDSNSGGPVSKNDIVVPVVGSPRIHASSTYPDEVLLFTPDIGSDNNAISTFSGVRVNPDTYNGGRLILHRAGNPFENCVDLPIDGKAVIGVPKVRDELKLAIGGISVSAQGTAVIDANCWRLDTRLLKGIAVKTPGLTR